LKTYGSLKVHPYLESIIDNQQPPEGFEADLTREEDADKWIRNTPTAFCNTRDEEILSQVLNDYDQETKDFYRWKLTYSQADLAELIARKSGRDFGSIVDLIPVERGKSERLTKLKIVGTKRTLIIGKELEIRKTLSESHLYSSAFVVDKVECSEWNCAGICTFRRRLGTWCWPLPDRRCYDGRQRI